MGKSFFYSLIVCSFLSSTVGYSQDQEVAEVSVDEVLQLVADGAILVDVREDSEVQKLAFDLEGIIYVPSSELEDRSNELPKNKKLIMACASGFRSARAMQILKVHGWSDMVNLVGGINQWQSKGYDVLLNGAKNMKACCSKNDKAKSCCSAKDKSQKPCRSTKKVN